MRYKTPPNCRLAINHPLRALRVPSSFDGDLRCGALNIAEIFFAELYRDCRDVLLQTMQFRGARNWNHPGLLSEEPGECYLSWRRILTLSDLFQQIDQRAVRLPSLRRETRYAVAEVGAVEASVL